jgi:hypothetical protein
LVSRKAARRRRGRRGLRRRRAVARRRALDEASRGRLSAVVARGDLAEDRAGSTLLLHDLPGVTAERVLVVGLGKRDEIGDKTFLTPSAALPGPWRTARPSTRR